jgi:1-deoxy-D-xylulose-5-phosphate reductoisomerase
MATPSPRLDLAALGQMTFEAPDPVRFPALRLARAALSEGRGATTVLNAANEIAVAAFLAGRIGFLDIAATVETVLERIELRTLDTLDDVFDLDAQARCVAEETILGRNSTISVAVGRA